MAAPSAWPAGVTAGLGRLLSRYAADLAVEFTYVCQVRRGVIRQCVDQTGTAVSLTATSLAPLADRVLERGALLMIDDLDTDSVLVELETDRPHGSFLGVGAFSDTGVLLGLLLAHGLTPRSWSNLDLERAGDMSQGIAASLMIDELRHNAEQRVSAEVQARLMRSQLHNISAQSASASSLPELSRVLVCETPELIDAAWALVGVRHADSEWQVYVDPSRRTQFGTIFVDEAANDDPGGANSAGVDIAAGEVLLEEVAALTDRSQITDFTEEPWAGVLEGLGGDELTSVLVAPLSPTDDVAMILLCGFYETELDLRSDQTFDEMIDDVQRVVLRTIDAQRQNQAAASLQRSLLPPRVPDLAGFEIGRLYNSATDHTRVGGDWYDIVQIDKATTGFVVGDVAGHDLRSAALMGQLRHVLASQLRDRRRPAGALIATDRYFADLDENVMATAVVMVVDESTQMLHIALAGHPPPVLLSSQTADLVAVSPGPPIGFGLGGYRDMTQPLEPGDILVAYTDGVVEDRSGDLSELLDSFVTAIGAAGRSVDELIRFLDERSQLGELVDDVAALVVRMTQAPSTTPR